MIRAFVGNFDFETQLVSPGTQLARPLREQMAHRASVWLAAAKDGDVIVVNRVDEAFDRELLAARSALEQSPHLPRVTWVSDLAELPAGVELVPWGWTEELARWAREHTSTVVPSMSVVRELNSRCWSIAQAAATNMLLPGEALVTSMEELQPAVERLLHGTGASGRWVLKANWGMSGREQRRGAGAVDDVTRAWVRRRLARDGVVALEPWLSAVVEFSAQFEIASPASVQFLGLVPLVSAPTGEYQGSWIEAARSEQLLSRSLRQWANWPAAPAIDRLLVSAHQVAQKAAEQAAQAGYIGPMGIDAMIYRPDGTSTDGNDPATWRVRPLQDVNARWTMGRLALAARRWLQPGECACWCHANELHQRLRAKQVLARELPLAYRGPSLLVIENLGTTPVSLVAI